MTTTTLPIHLNDLSLFKTQSYIDGKWTRADDGGTFAVDNPVDGSTIAQVDNLGQPQAQAAIDAADKALPAWRARTGKDRAKLIRAWFDLILANTEDLDIGRTHVCTPVTNANLVCRHLIATT